MWKVVVKEVGKPAEIRDVNDFKELQTIVGGHVEAVVIENGITMLCNEEGKLEGLPLNFLMLSHVSHDSIVGTAVFIGTKGENFASLRPHQIDYALNRFTK